MAAGPITGKPSIAGSLIRPLRHSCGVFRGLGRATANIGSGPDVGHSLATLWLPIRNVRRPFNGYFVVIFGPMYKTVSSLVVAGTGQSK